jgi:stringent starvation protein B
VSENVNSQRPYLLRAMHEWITDSGQTPHVVVDVMVDGVDVPRQHVQDGKIILNISYAAVQSLELGNDQISFEARFAGVPNLVSIPVSAVLGIYARETSRGMVFSDQDSTASENGTLQENGNGDKKSTAAEPGRPNLRVIK